MKNFLMRWNQLLVYFKNCNADLNFPVYYTMRQETITILPSKKWLKELIISDGVAKETLAKHINQKAKAAKRVKFLTQKEIISLFPKVFKQTTIETYSIGVELVLHVKAKKGFDLYKIFPKTF